MIKQYSIKVNGKQYQVEIEEIKVDAATSAPTPIAAAPAPTVVAPTLASKKPMAATPVDGTIIRAPMPGNIIDVLVTNGQHVKAKP
jgi:biotin carboxyl carrier protein